MGTICVPIFVAIMSSFTIFAFMRRHVFIIRMFILMFLSLVLVSCNRINKQEHQQMYKRLMRIKVEDKAYISQPSTTEIDSIITFFERCKDQKTLPWAYYLGGRVHHDHQDMLKALDYYQLSLDYLRPEKDLHLHSLIHSQLSSLFLSQQLLEEALSHICSAYQYDQAQKDTVGMIFDLRDMGNIYRSGEHEDSCLIYFRQALNFALLIKDQDLSTDVQSQIAAFYLQKDNATLCHQFILPALNAPDSTSISGIYSIAAEMYQQLGRTDSAIHYYKKLEETGNPYCIP